jgi:formiminotetrahydrofolate cyclodeaminase
MAAALAQMVAGLSRNKKSQAAHVDQLSDTLEAARLDAEELTAAIDRDAAAYDAVLAAFKLPRASASQAAARTQAIESATKGAAEVPLQVAQRTVTLFERLGQLAAIAAASMKSDLQVARLMAAAGAQGALANVEINLDSLSDTGYVSATREKIASLRARLGEPAHSLTV